MDIDRHMRIAPSQACSNQNHVPVVAKQVISKRLATRTSFETRWKENGNVIRQAKLSVQEILEGLEGNTLSARHSCYPAISDAAGSAAVTELAHGPTFGPVAEPLASADTWPSTGPRSNQFRRPTDRSRQTCCWLAQIPAGGAS